MILKSKRYPPPHSQSPLPPGEGRGEGRHAPWILQHISKTRTSLMTKEFPQVAWDAELQADWLRLLELAIDEDLGREGDWTTRAGAGGGHGPGGHRGPRRRRGRRPAGPAQRPGEIRSPPPLVAGDRGRPAGRARRAAGRHRGPGTRPAGRRAGAAERAFAPLGHRQPDAKIRRCGGRHEGPHLRHPQNHPRLAPPGEIRRPLRRRLEPSHRPVRGGAHQGQPPGLRRLSPLSLFGRGAGGEGCRRPVTGPPRRWPRPAATWPSTPRRPRPRP